MVLTIKSEKATLDLVQYHLELRNSFTGLFLRAGDLKTAWFGTDTVRTVMVDLSIQRARFIRIYVY